MATINIGEANQGDAFYRYKMPRLQSRIQGRGNGIKTEVVNNVDIAKALERPPDYIVKFFGCELGAQTKFDKAAGTSIVNGAHDTSKLVELLEQFIKKYVQCYNCGNPETVVKIRKENILLKCKACGHVSDVDMRHRLNTYILKNPPEEKISKNEKKLRKQEKERLKEVSGEALDKEEKKKKKKEKESSSSKKKKKGEDDSPVEEDDDDDVDGVGNEDEVVWMTDTSEAAAQKRAEEQLSAAMAGMVTQGNIEAEQEAARKREEKRKAEEEAAHAAEEAARKAEEEAALKAAEDAAKDPVKQVQASLAKGKPAATAAMVKLLDVEGGPAGRMRVLYEAIFGEDGGGKLAHQAVAHKALLAALAQDPASQMAQLIAVEHYVGETATAALIQVAHILKALYDEDIVSEALIIAWHGKGNAGKVLGVSTEAGEAVRQAAAPFIQWLEEAESDDESDED